MFTSIRLPAYLINTLYIMEKKLTKSYIKAIIYLILAIICTAVCIVYNYPSLAAVFTVFSILIAMYLLNAPEKEKWEKRNWR